MLELFAIMFNSFPDTKDKFPVSFLGNFVNKNLKRLVLRGRCEASSDKEMGTHLEITKNPCKFPVI